MSRRTFATTMGFETQLALAGVPAHGGLGGSGRKGGRTYPGPFTAYRPPGFRLETGLPACDITWPARTET